MWNYSNYHYTKGGRVVLIRILIADDEGLMLNSMKTIISTNFGDECEVFTAKTGRVAVEIADEEKPDIALMDIHMPGLNGIEAMQKIREKNKNIKFIVITAYNKFDYAKEAINIGVFDFISKPVAKATIIDVLTRAIKNVEEKRKNKIDNIRIREKLETVIPIIENGFVSNLLLQNGSNSENEYYKEIMNIEEKYAYIILLQFGEDYKNGVLTNPVGTGMRLQKEYDQIRKKISDSFHCIIGSMISNKIVIVVFSNKEDVDYDERISIIERTRNLVYTLEESTDARFMAGIGHTMELDKVKESYIEAMRCLEEGESHVAHVDDLPLAGKIEDDYPIDVEKKLFSYIEQGDVIQAKQQAKIFFDILCDKFGQYDDDIKLKVLELVMRAEMMGVNAGGLDYGFRYRKDYLSNVIAMRDYGSLCQWFIEKISIVCENISSKHEDRSETVISKAMDYIDENYTKNISLDDVSKAVNISSYYFSKLFKEEAGVNFIDYLTKKRIDYAKELLEDNKYSIKEVCVMCGYSDPNYFSRIFKKKENVTPSEYRG